MRQAILLVLVALLWIQVRADILFGTTLGLTVDGTNTIDPFSYFAKAAVDGINIAFAEANAKYAEAGLTCEQELRLIVHDHNFDPAKELANIRSLVNETGIVALLCTALQNSKQIVPYLAFSDIPLVGSLVNEEIYYTPFRRNIINILPSFRDEAAAQLHFLTNRFTFTRFTIVYLESEYTSGIAHTFSTLLPRVGLRPLSLHPVSPVLGTADPRYAKAVQRIISDQPQAVLVAGANVLVTLLAVAEQLGSPFNDSSIVFMVDSTTIPFLEVSEETLSCTALPPRLYATASLPLLGEASGNDLPIVQSFLRASQRYAHAVAADAAPVQQYSLAGYIAGRLAVSVVDSLGARRNTATPASFVDALYAMPTFNTSDGLSLTFAADCNVGSRQMYVYRVVQVAASVVHYVRLPEWTFRWPTVCSSEVTDNALPPYVFGEISTETPFSLAARSAFEASNREGARQVFGRSAYLVADHVPDEPIADTATRLIEQYGVLALVGFSDHEIAQTVDVARGAQTAFFAPVSGNPMLRNSANGTVAVIDDVEGDIPLFINLRVRWDDEVVMATMHYVTECNFTRFGFFGENSSQSIALRDLLVDLLDTYSQIATTDKSVAAPSLTWQLLFDPEDELNTAVNVVDNVDIVFLFCPSNASHCVDFFALVDNAVAAASMREHVGVSTSGSSPTASRKSSLHTAHLIWACDTQDFLEKAMAKYGWFVNGTQPPCNVSLSSSYPSPWQPGFNDTEDDTITSQYLHQMTSLYGKNDNGTAVPIAPTLESLEGFISGRFLLAVLSATRNNATHESVAATVFDHSIFPLADDFRLGPYDVSTCRTGGPSQRYTNGGSCGGCNQGARTLWLLSLKPAVSLFSVKTSAYIFSGGPYYWDPIAQYGFSGCSFRRPVVRRNRDDDKPNTAGGVSTRGDNEDTAAVLIGVIVGGIVGAAGVTVATVVVAVYYRRYKDPTAARRRRLKEPNYRQLALAAGRDFLESARVESLFYAVLPPTLPDKEIRDRLGVLDEMLLTDVDMARYIARVLCGGNPLNSQHSLGPGNSVNSATAVDSVEPLELAYALCIVYHAYHKGAELLIAFAIDEVQTALRRCLEASAARRTDAGEMRPPRSTTSTATAAVLFRQDSFLSKLFKVHSRLVGLPFLWQTLAAEMRDIEDASHLKATSQLGSVLRLQRRKHRAAASAPNGSEDWSAAEKASTPNGDGDSETLSTSGTSLSSSTAAITMTTDEFSLEIDPKRARRGDDPVANSLQLRLVVHRIVQSLQASACDFPVDLRKFLTGLRTALEQQGPIARPLVQPSIAAFVFLRFVCPAVTSPQSHGLFRNPPTARAQRFLVLLSKVLMNLALGIMFDKEEYLVPLNEFITQNSTSAREVLVKLSNSDCIRSAAECVTDQEPPVVPIRANLKTNALKLIYYHLATHQPAIAAFGNQLPSGLSLAQDHTKWHSFVMKLQAIGIK